MFKVVLEVGVIVVVVSGGSGSGSIYDGGSNSSSREF